MMKRREMITSLSAVCALPFIPKFSLKEYFDHVEILRIEVENLSPLFVTESSESGDLLLIWVIPETYNQTKEGYFQEKLKNVSYFKDTFVKHKYCYFISVKDKPEYAAFYLARDKVEFVNLAEVLSKPLMEPVMT